MKKFLVFKFVLIGALTLSASLAYAQGEDLIEAEKKLDQSIADLNKAESAELVEERTEEEIAAENAEIAKRVAAFEAVLSYTEEEILELSSRLASLEYDFSDDLWDFHKAIKKHFLDAESERASFASMVEDNDSKLEDIKALALEFKEWRSGNYDAKNRAFFDFLLLVKADKVIKVAEKRVRGIDKDLNKFEDDFGEIGNLQLRVLFAQAQLELGEARNSLSMGNGLFEENFQDLFFPVVEELSEDEESDEVLDLEEADDSEELEDIDISGMLIGHVQTAIRKVQDAYGVFLDMSELAKQLLREE